MSVDNPEMAFELIAAMSLVGNVAMSSVLRAAICFEPSAPTWALVRAPTCAPVLQAAICAVLSALMLCVLRAAIWAVVRRAMVSVGNPGIALELIAAISLVVNVAMSSGPEHRNLCGMEIADLRTGQGFSLTGAEGGQLLGA